ncbi:MAG TPA: TorF family putative porin, partial [Usitatibacter sp.]|nr:TorF family putative porin [Usitatibacter sp.]
MRNCLAVIVAAAAFPFAPAAWADETPEHTFATKLGLWSEYEYRGISQTSEKPALQLNLDYSHKSGLYLGTFLSNIQWLKDTADVNGFDTGARVEWDIYGGYKFEVVKDVTLDVGYLRYEYPSSGAFNPSPNTDEAYIGAAYGPLSAKYSYSFNNTFGVPNSKGSDYFEIDYNQAITPVSDKLTFNGVVGHQTYAH